MATKAELLQKNAIRFQKQAKDIERTRLARRAIRYGVDEQMVRRVFELSASTYTRLCGQVRVS